MSHQISATSKNKRKLMFAFALTTTYMIAEAIGGWLTHSLALWADAGHMLTDAGALGLALFAVWFAERPANAEKTYGYYRAEILAALLNAVILLFISANILYEAWQRLRNPPEVMGFPMLLIASVGLLLNLVSMKILASASGESLNIKGAYLEVLSDLLSSVGVIIAGIIILSTGWYLADPILSAGIGLFIIPRTWSLLKQAVHILMEGTPTHLNLQIIEEAMKKVQGVQAIHDLHIWTITSGVDAISCHVTIAPESKGDFVLSQLQRMLQEEFGLKHSTLQLEQERCEGEDCHRL